MSLIAAEGDSMWKVKESRFRPETQSDVRQVVNKSPG